MKPFALFTFTLAFGIRALLAAADEAPKLYVLETGLGKFEDDSLVSEIRISLDGKRLIQLVVRDEQYFVALNDQMSPAYDGITKDSLRFSPDGKRYCYGARIGDRKFVMAAPRECPCSARTVSISPTLPCVEESNA